ncbi:phorbol esters/diacylglycerol binding domain protein [Trichuris suis]|nr:phorbol esters/diacylglycerol binding domain protein [Trichuris suis]
MAFEVKKLSTFRVERCSSNSRLELSAFLHSTFVQWNKAQFSQPAQPENIGLSSFAVRSFVPNADVLLSLRRNAFWPACGLNYHKRCARKIPNNCSGCYRWKTRLFSLSPDSDDQPAAVSGPTSPANVAYPGGGENVVSSRDINHVSGYCTPTGASFPGDIGAVLFLGIIPRKDRSSSWSGRPIWMELEDAKRTKVPHTFRLHTYAKPTVCHYCKKLLKGLVRQGLQCADCNYNCHKKCEQYVPNDCSGTISELASALTLGDELTDSLFSPMDGERLKPNRRSLPSSSAGRIKEPVRQSSSDQDISSFSSAVEGIPSRKPNIPLMRLVMTKKRTKAACNKVLQEGWVVFHTSKNKLRRRHYWCLTPKSIVMYADETCTRRCREVPLSRVLAVHQSPSASPLFTSLAENKRRTLELRTVSSNYFAAIIKQCSSRFV